MTISDFSIQNMVETKQYTNERRYGWVTLGIIGIAGIGLCMGAFSTGTRQAIIERDGGCVMGDDCAGPLQAAHYNHDRTYPLYDDPSNGRALCVRHHFEDHHCESAGRNGLSIENNRRARLSLLQQLRQLNS